MRTFKDEDAAFMYIASNILWGAAAGTCKESRLARRFAEAGMKIVTYGSITAKQRSGNTGDNFWFDEATGNSINAWGIPNKGFDVHLQDLQGTRKDVNSHGTQLWVSLSAGDTFIAQEYHDMAERAPVDVVEGNFSCGNMLVGTEYKPVVCYDLGAFDDGIAALCAGAGKKKKAAKLTPTTERRFLFGNIESCLKHGVDYIILANTVPNCYLEKPDGTPAITMVRGGLGGKALKPIVTGMLQMVKPLLKGTKVKLIAAGGIECGEDAYWYLTHGADGFVFSTLLWKSDFDPTVGRDIILGDESRGMKGLAQLLVERGLPD